MNEKFEEWFYQQVSWHILAEEFYCDLDLFAFYSVSGQDQKAKDFQLELKQWLVAAFEAGVQSEKENKQDS